MSSLLQSREKLKTAPTGRTVLITRRRSPAASIKAVLLISQLVGLLALVVYLPQAQQGRLICAVTPWAKACQK
jgi:hypothetical protein